MQLAVTKDDSTDVEYVQTFQGSLPADLPGGQLRLVANLRHLGRSNAVDITVRHTVTGIAPTSGSIAGGQLVTISGTGFASSGARVVLAGVPCDVQVATATELQCLTGPASAADASFAEGDSAAVLYVQPSSFASLDPVEGLSYAYVAAPSVAAVSPPRGSSLGGTPVTITGSGFTNDIVSVAMGDTMCSDVTFVSESEIRCDAQYTSCP